MCVVGPDGQGSFTQHYFDTRGVARVYEMKFEAGRWSSSASTRISHRLTSHSATSVSSAVTAAGSTAPGRRRPTARTGSRLPADLPQADVAAGQPAPSGDPVPDIGLGDLDMKSCRGRTTGSRRSTIDSRLRIASRRMLCAERHGPVPPRRQGRSCASISSIGRRRSTGPGEVRSGVSGGRGGDVCRGDPDEHDGAAGRVGPFRSPPQIRSAARADRCSRCGVVSRSRR